MSLIQGRELTWIAMTLFMLVALAVPLAAHGFMRWWRKRKAR